MAQGAGSIEYHYSYLGTCTCTNLVYPDRGFKPKPGG